MSNFISRFFVVCLLLSIVTAVSAQQAPDRNIDKSKQEVKKGQDGKSKSASNKGSSRLQNDDTAAGAPSSGVKNKPSGPGAKAAPGGGNSARIGNVTTAQKSGKKSRKGFLGRLLGRSNKSSKASGSSSPGRQPGQPSAGEPKGDKDGKKTAPGETDPRDRP